jgi:hypothetical protein
MLIIINDDPAYVSWVSRHRSGYVLDAHWKRAVKHAVLHRASCSEIKSPKSKRTRWTTAPHVKACSLALPELFVWAKEQTGEEPPCCQLCQPTGGSATAHEAPHEMHLTKLARRALEAVIEAALISLDHDPSQYRLTVADVAKELGKSPAQLAAAFSQLVIDGYLRAEGAGAPSRPLRPASLIFPTASALRSLPAYAEMGPSAAQADLDRLARPLP